MILDCLESKKIGVDSMHSWLKFFSPEELNMLKNTCLKARVGKNQKNRNEIFVVCSAISTCLSIEKEAPCMSANDVMHPSRELEQAIHLMYQDFIEKVVAFYYHQKTKDVIEGELWATDSSKCSIHWPPNPAIRMTTEFADKMHTPVFSN